MLGRGNSRTYFYLLIAVALAVIILTTSQTSLPQMTITHVQSLIGHKEEVKPLYNSDKWFYQVDLESIKPINFDFDRVRGLPPHNSQGPGREVFATLYASRNGTLQDPYFVAAQQIIYRLLWKKDSASRKHPVVVFVTQHVSQVQRDYFTAAGAIVRELALRPFEPEMAGVPARLQDMFSKLEMWRQLDFTRIAYMDSDAIPLMNIDDIFAQSPNKACQYDLVPEEDKVYGKEICNYAFAAHLEGYDGVNAGVMIFKPEQAMYQRLVRESHNTTGWDTGYLEQALLSTLYHNDGPFPPTILAKEYNSFPDYRKQGIKIKILHDKMWSHIWDEGGSWEEDDWSSTWAEMEEFYQSEDFHKKRLTDKYSMLAGIKTDASKLGHVIPPQHSDYP